MVGVLASSPSSGIQVAAPKQNNLPPAIILGYLWKRWSGIWSYSFLYPSAEHHLSRAFHPSGSRAHPRNPAPWTSLHAMYLCSSGCGNMSAQPWHLEQSCRFASSRPLSTRHSLQQHSAPVIDPWASCSLGHWKSSRLLWPPWSQHLYSPVQSWCRHLGCPLTPTLFVIPHLSEVLDYLVLLLTKVPAGGHSGGDGLFVHLVAKFSQPCMYGPHLGEGISKAIDCCLTQDDPLSDLLRVIQSSHAYSMALLIQPQRHLFLFIHPPPVRNAFGKCSPKEGEGDQMSVNPMGLATHILLQYQHVHSDK